MRQLDLVIVGPSGNTHIADSLVRAAEKLGLICRLVDTAPAYDGPKHLKSAFWHLLGRRPLKLSSFSSRLRLEVLGRRPRWLIAVGQAPLRHADIEAMSAEGITCLNFSTDDPWNSVHRAAWYIKALPAYTTILTPRQSNVSEFVSIGCKAVRYLPFAYDEFLFPLSVETEKAENSDLVLFVGGADRDRVGFFLDYLETGPKPTLVGGYWERYPQLSAYSIGHLAARDLRELTARAAVNICLVRRANRDGHVMRSFEIPACGTLMLAEDTLEHREIFGPDGHCALYFSTPREAADRVKWALEHSEERKAIANRAMALIKTGGHTYTDRLKAMLELNEC